MVKADDTTPKPHLFEIELPCFTLEGGARIRHHIVRGSIWSNHADFKLLGPRSRSLSEAEYGAALSQSVVRRPELGSRPTTTCGWAQGEERCERQPNRDTLLVIHALTGDMLPGGPSGFWEPVIGPGRALDPEKARILCFNNLGSCYGTSGPADGDFPSRSDDRPELAPTYQGKGAFSPDDPRLPATITTWDQARSILMALDALGIETVQLATGGSLGGMIALALAALAPERFERIALFGAAERASPWIIGWNHISRQLLLKDPEFPQGCSRSLELARQIAHMTYRADAGLALRQSRSDEAARQFLPQRPFPAQTYLEHQGRKLRRRFDARAYLTQLDAMDHHDLERRPPPPEAGESWTNGPGKSWGLERVRSSCLAVGIDSDVLFPSSRMRELARKLEKQGSLARFQEIKSAHGHDAFLIEWDQMSRLLEEALALPLGGKSS